MDDSLEQATMRKVAFRLIPFLCILYIIAFIDRINIGFASLTMSEDLGLSPTMFGLGAGIFFISYFLCEVPSNLIMHRVGARRWIARVMITWGPRLSGTLFANVSLGVDPPLALVVAGGAGATGVSSHRLLTPRWLTAGWLSLFWV